MEVLKELLCTASTILLYGRAFHSTVGAEYTTVACPGFQ